MFVRLTARPLLLLIGIVTTAAVFAQAGTKCCESQECKTRAADFAATLARQVAPLRRFDHADPANNEESLRAFKASDPEAHRQFLKTAQAAYDYLFSPKRKFDGDECFNNAIPEGQAANVTGWMMYVARVNTASASIEFRQGFRVRLELSQGPSDIRKGSPLYMGSVRAYGAYTFGKTGSEGNLVRIMAGPAWFVRTSQSFLALSSRVALRIRDIKPFIVRLGNLNVYGEYDTNFGEFDYGALGVELELGFLGTNLALTNNLNNGKKGVAVGVFYLF